MNDTDQLVLGSLLHDIGKFFERAELLGDYRSDNDEQQQYCPWNTEKKYYSHRHVLNTLKFCEILAETIPQIKPKQYQRHKKADQHWINLAGLHHNPSESEMSKLEKLVQAADHLASAEREKGNYYEKKINQLTRLESLLGRVTIGENPRNNDCFLPLSSSQLSKQTIYPKAASLTGMVQKKNEQGTVWLSAETLVNDYKKIAKTFLEEINKLQSFQANTDKNDILHSVVRSLLSLMEYHLAQVPAATNVLHPDISLYDHLRISSAIAEGLYDYHINHEDDNDYKNNHIAKWSLVCGDFSGIQKFIYKIISKGAAKGLRGRSFFIQLLCDAVSEHLIRKLGLYATARIYSSGGKFYLLIPVSRKQALNTIVDQVNEALLAQFQGEVFLGIGTTDITADKFKQGNMGECWKAVNDDLMKNRQQPFKAQVSQDISCFSQQSQHDMGACQLCGRDDVLARLKMQEELVKCQQCIDLQNIGKQLAKTHYLFWVWGKDRTTVKNSKLANLCKVEMPGTECTLYFLQTKPEFSELTHLAHSHLEVLNQWEGFNKNNQGYSQGIRYVGKWQKQQKDSADWEFDDFADNAAGISRMGILRMDVDNLGEIFIRGLRFGKQQQKHMGSLSRVATLSRQLQMFFGGYLHEIMKDYSSSQIIYAGGDDVFIIGSWDELPDVAYCIKQEFSRFCANNPHFTLSAGIALVGGKYPISRAAALAGDAEENAKNLIRGNNQKDALCFLETAIGWESFDEAVQFRELIQRINDKTGSNAIIERLRQVVIAVEEINQNHTQGNIQEQVLWNRWRWRLVYNLKRMEKRYKGIADDLNELQKQLVITQTSSNKQTAMDWLQMPVRWAEYLMRSKKQ